MKSEAERAASRKYQQKRRENPHKLYCGCGERAVKIHNNEPVCRRCLDMERRRTKEEKEAERKIRIRPKREVGLMVHVLHLPEE